MNKHYEEAAKAKAQLATEESANEQYMGEQGMTDEVMQFSALNRIAEAALALAYEQRTANLIALHSQPGLAIDYDTLRDRIIGRVNDA